VSRPLLADRYELLEPLGKGSFAHTWRARDADTGASVAVKLLDPRTSEWKARELFEREAMVLRSLRHPGIPAVVAAFRAQWDGAEIPCLAMEYVEGTSLATAISERRRMSDADALAVFVDLLGILDYLHTRVPPVLHRDIKPANIVLRPNGSASLVDFGSVREGFASGASEAGSTVAGTYGYMPYEQYMGQAVPSSDLYALAATMLHLLTGKAPREFMGSEGRIEVPADLAVGAHLRGVIARMLAQSPAQRYATARDVQRALVVPTAVVPAAEGGTIAVPPSIRVAKMIDLGPAPRELSGAAAEHFPRVAYTMWEMMASDEKHTDRGGVIDWVTYAFFCTITAGILPAVFASMSRTRRKRTELFFREGVSAMATITAIRNEKGPFEAPMAKVQYEFTLDGALHRDTDSILPQIANRWRVGDTIQVLVIPDRAYDSIIVTAE
jgi:serine/threonine protein kinase